MNNSTVSFFVDTNLFLQCRPLDQLDWTSWGAVDVVRLIVSSPVLREIDYRKNKGNDRIGTRARRTSAMFRGMLNDGQKVVREASPRVILSVEPHHPYCQNLEDRLNYNERDDQLVGTLHYFARRHEGADVRLLTHDTTPLFTARSLGLNVDIIPENWLLTPEATENEKELRSLKSELIRLKKTEPSFSIRCVDQSSTELECYHFHFTWFKPLTDDQIGKLMHRLKYYFPLEADFGSREPAERTPKRRTALDILGNTKEVFVPATAEQIEKYTKEAYPEWLDQCERILQNHHRALQCQAPLPMFSFLAENTGTRPAADALVTVEAHGHFQIQPPSSDNDIAQSSEDDDSTILKVTQFPRPPAAPIGRWQRTMGNFLTSINRFSHMGMGQVSLDRHGTTLPALDFRPPSHDPNAFYFKPHRPSSPQTSFSLSCDQWRHDDGEEPFDGEVHFSADQDKAEGALLFRIQASNLSKSSSKRIPVRIKVAHISAFESARAMVDKLVNSP